MGSAMFNVDLSTPGFLASASLILAAVHVLWTFIYLTLMRGETRILHDQREKVRLARAQELEVERRILAISDRVEDIGLSILQAQRRFDQESDAKLRFEIIVGRPAPGHHPYRGHIQRSPMAAQGRDAIVWINPVKALIWAPSPDRARVALADSFPRGRGFATLVEGAGGGAPEPVEAPLKVAR